MLGVRSQYPDEAAASTVSFAVFRGVRGHGIEWGDAIMSTSTERLITLICPNLECRRTVAVPEAARGTQFRCAFCNKPFKVPAAPPPPSSVDRSNDDRDRDRQ